MTKTKPLLDHFPRLAPLDDATQALFNAISRHDTKGVRDALAQGARLDQPQPFSVGTQGNDIDGGLLPLQAACSMHPQAPAPVEIIELLLENGANPQSYGVDDPGNTPLDIICRRLPRNASRAIGLLVAHGAQVHIEMLREILVGHRSWVDQKNPVHYAEAAMDALWEVMPGSEKQKLSPEWIMGIVPNTSDALDYNQIKRVQWLSNHCQMTPHPALKDRVEQRRADAKAPARPSHPKLH